MYVAELMIVILSYNYNGAHGNKSKRGNLLLCGLIVKGCQTVGRGMRLGFYIILFIANNKG